MGFLLIGLVLRPGANRVTGEKYCEKKTLRGTFVSAETYGRGAVSTLSLHLEGANEEGVRKRQAERERERERERYMFL